MDNILENLLQEGNVSKIITYLQQTDNASHRNEIALYLIDNEIQESVPLLVSLVKKLATTLEIGTLIYALQFLESTAYTVELLPFLFSTNYEARAMTFALLCTNLPKMNRKQLEQAIYAVSAFKRFKGKKRVMDLLNDELHKRVS